MPVQTRRANEGVQPRGHRQTTLSEEVQRDLKLKRDSARIQRTRALLKAAQDRLLAHLAILDEALIGSGPCGSFTFYEEVAIDFAMRMDLYLTAEQMAREPSAVNRAAVQAFAKCVKAGGLASLHAARSTTADRQEMETVSADGRHRPSVQPGLPGQSSSPLLYVSADGLRGFPARYPARARSDACRPSNASTRQRAS